MPSEHLGQSTFASICQWSAFPVLYRQIALYMYVLYTYKIPFLVTHLNPFQPMTYATTTPPPWISFYCSTFQRRGFAPFTLFFLQANLMEAPMKIFLLWWTIFTLGFSIIKNKLTLLWQGRSPQIVESCHPGWENMEKMENINQKTHFFANFRVPREKQCSGLVCAQFWCHRPPT